MPFALNHSPRIARSPIVARRPSDAIFARVHEAAVRAIPKAADVRAAHVHFAIGPKAQSHDHIAIHHQILRRQGDRARMIQLAMRAIKHSPYLRPPQAGFPTNLAAVAQEEMAAD